MTLFKLRLLIAFCLSFPACALAQEGDPLLFIRETEAAHGSTEWNRKNGVQAILEVEFEGRDSFRGDLLMNPRATQVRLTREDGAVAVYDGRTVWVQPNTADWDEARADLIGWAYWWALPHKLQDPGVRLEPLGQEEWEGKTYDVATLSFDEGVGDTPGDRYRLYQDPTTGRLEVVVVLPEGQADGWALRYEDFREIEEIPIPHRWQFFRWSPQTGLGEPVGEASLQDVHFYLPARDAYDRLPGARQISQPDAD